MSTWIRTADRLPLPGSLVWAYFRHFDMSAIVLLDEMGWWTPNRQEQLASTPTHWALIRRPKPPREDV